MSADPEDPDTADAGAEQRRVRDDLSRLAELLDRGEDGWVVRRAVERLLAEQRRLRDETERLGSATTSMISLLSTTTNRRGEMLRVSKTRGPRLSPPSQNRWNRGTPSIPEALTGRLPSPTSRMKPTSTW